jgi:hypothetical protein
MWHRLARAIREREPDVRTAGRPSTIADTPSVSASSPGGSHHGAPDLDSHAGGA